VQESELAEIERRILEHLVQARREMLKLTGECRKLSGIAEPTKASAQYSPLHDSVTGLLNHDAYGVQFFAARARAKRNKKKYAVLSVYLAFPREKPTAQEYDVVLRMVAQRIEKCVRTTDTAARVDRDEFAILLEDLTSDAQAHLVMQKLQKVLSDPVSIGERQFHLDASVNIQVHPKAREGSPPV
jgi:diguanylate cyclase (GGDEF)-like protein